MRVMTATPKIKCKAASHPHEFLRGHTLLLHAVNSCGDTHFYCMQGCPEGAILRGHTLYSDLAEDTHFYPVLPILRGDLRGLRGTHTLDMSSDPARSCRDTHFYPAISYRDTSFLR